MENLLAAPWPWHLALAVLLGLCVGSFVTLASYRLPRGEDIIATSSRCPSCREKLGWRDLWPVVSWLWQRGKCRRCGAGVHWRYPAIEVVQAALFAGLWLRYGWTVDWLLLALLSAALLVMIVADLEHYMIPDSVQVAVAALGLAWSVIVGRGPEDLATGVALGAGTGLALHYGYYYLRGRHGLGLGDVKFLAAAGCWLNPYGFVLLFLFSGLLGVLTALLWRALKRGEYFPFGPALAVSLLILCVFPSLAESLQAK